MERHSVLRSKIVVENGEPTPDNLSAGSQSTYFFERDLRDLPER